LLGVSSYSQAYVDSVRASVAGQLAAYKAMAKTAKAGTVAKFEPLFTANLVLALDAAFVHRLRGKEGKDGNPLNEVRLLSASLLTNDGVLTADKTIKYKAEQSVLGLDIGDTITVSEADFAKLAQAFLAEIEVKFPEG
jgi:hypothetical protein